MTNYLELELTCDKLLGIRVDLCPKRENSPRRVFLRVRGTSNRRASQVEGPRYKILGTGTKPKAAAYSSTSSPCVRWWMVGRAGQRLFRFCTGVRWWLFFLFVAVSRILQGFRKRSLFLWRRQYDKVAFIRSCLGGTYHTRMVARNLCTTSNSLLNLLPAWTLIYSIFLSSLLPYHRVFLPPSLRNPKPYLTSIPTPSVSVCHSLVTICLFLLSIPFTIFALFLVTKRRGHIAGSTSPFPASNLWHVYMSWLDSCLL